MLIVMPIAGFIGGVIGAVMYNIAASTIGGLELELETA
jgi:hypothetical protein